MKTLRKKLMKLRAVTTIFALSLVVNPTITTAEECKDSLTKCQDARTAEGKACGEALDAKNKALGLGDLALKKCKEVNGGLQRSVTEQDEKLSSWTRNPFVVSLLGVAAGALAVTLLKK